MSTTAWDFTEEYESVCKEMARKGRTGRMGDLLPCNMSHAVYEAIHTDLYAFQQRIREHAYALSMEKLVTKEHP